MQTLRDQKTNPTTWAIDIEGRTTLMTFADAKTVRYDYEAKSGRLTTVTDALNQVKTLAYAMDDRLVSTTYSGAVNPTPNVIFGYDAFFPRRTSMTDGNGTTSWTYVALGVPGALRVLTETGPFANAAITYGYDSLGRTTSQRVGPDAPETWGFDALGRMAGHGTALGSFVYGYLGQTPQTATRTLSATTIGTSWTSDQTLSLESGETAVRAIAFDGTHDVTVAARAWPSDRGLEGDARQRLADANTRRALPERGPFE